MKILVWAGICISLSTSQKLQDCVSCETQLMNYYDTLPLNL